MAIALLWRQIFGTDGLINAVLALSEEHGLTRWTTDLDVALSDADAAIYCDAQLTSLREPAIKSAIAAGKHVHTEKPLAVTLDGALSLARAAEHAGICAGVVQDKLFLPGLRKLERLIDGGFFGRVLSLRGEFGYWVFEGDWQRGQRPSWNYRTRDGGGIVLDMFCHWSYVLEHLLGPVRAVTATVVTHIPERLGRERPILWGHGRRRSLRHLRARRWCDRADQLVVVCAGAP